MAESTHTRRLLLCFLIAFPLACKHTPPGSLQNWQDETQEAIEEAKDKAKEWKELSQQEIDKIWAIEYKSVYLSRSDAEGLEMTLNDLGRERWDCYHVGEEEGERILYLKRRKSSVLRSIPLSDLLRIWALSSGADH